MTEDPSRGGRSGRYLDPYSITVAYGNGKAGITTGTGADWYGPLDPVRPLAPPEVAGRQFDYPSGFNLSTTPRINEPVSFAMLRALADGYDLLRLVIETRKDQVARRTWSIHSRSAAAGTEEDPRIAVVTEFFRHPDGQNSWGDWLRMVLEDVLVIDAPALYVARTRSGKVHALLPIDGATIKPVIDDWGRIPMEPGQTAFQQVLKGYPAVDYSYRDLIYKPRNKRSNKVYGFSPVEQIITTVNIALRKQLFNLNFYTEGNIPSSFIGVPDDWTPDQITAFQKYWDSYFEGDLKNRRKAKFVPGGVARTFIQTQDPEMQNSFDEWLARIVFFAFSLSPQPIIKMMNRGSAESARKMAEEEGVAPFLVWIKELVDGILEKEFGAPDLEFKWDQDRAVDEQSQFKIVSGYVERGILTLNEARAVLGRPPFDNAVADQPMVMTASGLVPVDALMSGQQGGQDEGSAGPREDSATKTQI